MNKNHFKENLTGKIVKKVKNFVCILNVQIFKVNLVLNDFSTNKICLELKNFKVELRIEILHLVHDFHRVVLRFRIQKSSNGMVHVAQRKQEVNLNVL